MQHILTANETAALMASAHRPNFVLQARSGRVFGGVQQLL